MALLSQLKTLTDAHMELLKPMVSNPTQKANLKFDALFVLQPEKENVGLALNLLKLLNEESRSAADPEQLSLLNDAISSILNLIAVNIRVIRVSSIKPFEFGYGVTKDEDSSASSDPVLVDLVKTLLEMEDNSAVDTQVKVCVTNIIIEGFEILFPSVFTRLSILQGYLNLILTGNRIPLWQANMVLGITERLASQQSIEAVLNGITFDALNDDNTELVAMTSEGLSVFITQKFKCNRFLINILDVLSLVSTCSIIQVGSSSNCQVSSPSIESKRQLASDLGPYLSDLAVQCTKFVRRFQRCLLNRMTTSDKNREEFSGILKFFHSKLCSLVKEELSIILSFMQNGISQLIVQDMFQSSSANSFFEWIHLIGYVSDEPVVLHGLVESLLPVIHLLDAINLLLPQKTTILEALKAQVRSRDRAMGRRTLGWQVVMGSFKSDDETSFKITDGGQVIYFLSF